MKGVVCNVKACVTFDRDMPCCDCDCTAGGGNKESKERTKKHMVCVHIFPTIMKITTLLCDFLVDDLCYELTAHLTNRNVHEK